MAIVTTSAVVTGCLLSLRQVGALQPLELASYDLMVRLRPDRDADSRLLLVAITESDIKAQKHWPLSDWTIATALQKLQQFQPSVIGLDLYRDLPQEPGKAALTKQLQQPNVIAITKVQDADDLGVAPPPGVPADRIGFNDVTSDPDGVIRRGLLFVDTDQTTLYAFSLRLAIAYLHQQGISPQAGLLNPSNLRFGDTEFIPLEPTAGAYQSVDANGYQILLNYRARSQLARQVTLTQVLSGTIDPSWVNGKIVLLGTTARSARDIFLTPYSTAEKQTASMPGVVIHAQMVSQFLGAALNHEPLFWFWSDWVEVLWIGAWVVMGGSLAWFIRHPLGLGLAITVTITALLGTCYLLFLHQGWVPTATPAIGVMTVAILVVSYRAQQAQRQQMMMMKLLGQNTSPEIARALWKSRDRLLKSGKLPGQRLTATMLFTDIRNFSTLSEQMPPENLLEWLNEYLSAITEEVRVNQGIINKFTGDGLLAVFGVPMNRLTQIEVSQDARLAVECALAMRDRLQELNQDWQQRHLPTAQMRVGIFTGPIVAGSLGGKDRLEYGVIGDSVNIASRLESYAKDQQLEVCRILIAKDTLVHLQDRFAVEPWGPLALKGKQQMIDVYRVLGYASDVLI
ncbi:adenylate/guanylate cyclase domain-containing protein [Stenomitos frigidus ULC18]|uniref:Adenylate/guanylate cyclase domain-containing protein n=1 Tax=Stenomitos frigidus ULC18 TaxID=2107698 RepID=A0A2T1E004_9CYAN|nr:adenylate/guanylate cyclase domain-containing protein [Stenomitos frigidus ULC18]